MAKIKAFKGILYNQEKIKDLSKVTCPPYDIIKPKEQERYYANHSYNIIRLILGKSNPGDNESENKYSRANRCLEDWIAKQILVQDDKPAIYFYAQKFLYRTEKKQRQGFIALMSLADNGGSVFPHEHTHLAPKEDRLQLMRATKANLCPIFVLFSDKDQYIQKMKEYIVGFPPILDLKDTENSQHQLWRIDDKNLIAGLAKSMEFEPIFIADGHHRFEVAVTFRNEMRANTRNFNGSEDFNFIMTYFTDLNSSDLLIMPVHRLLKNIDKEKLNNLENKLKDKFLVQLITDKEKLFSQMQSFAKRGHCLGLYRNKQFMLLRLKNDELIGDIASDEPLSYRILDVNIMNYLIFKEIFNLELPRDERISYTQDAQEAINLVDNNLFDICFFLNPVTTEQLVEVASSGSRMPPKSTYFYPKLLSGLVLNRFNEEV